MATSAQLFYPSGVVVDSIGNLYVTNLLAAGNFGINVRKVTKSIGIMRASLAKPYETDDIYRPGMALKFFAEGKPSINFHVMHSLDCQGTNKNYFANIFSNMVADPTEMALKLLSIPFNWAIHHDMDRGPSCATELPLDEAARLGNENWAAPFQIKFIPTSYAQNLIRADDPESDVRKQLGMIQFDLNQPIYEILASTQEGEEYTVGELFLEGEEFVASEYGDTKLFFKHQRH